MDAPRAVLALFLCCILSGNVFGYEYGEEYQDSYYNSISIGEPSKYAVFEFSFILIYLYCDTKWCVLPI